MSSEAAPSDELRRWIIEQVQLGRGSDQILVALIQAGWAEHTAMDAMERVLREHLAEQAVRAGLPPAGAVPEPALSESPSFIDVNGHRIDVLMAMASPRLVLFGHLLSDEECDQLVELARPRLTRSLTVAQETGGEETNAARTSDGMFFECAENPLVLRIEQRIASLLNWPLEFGEGLQVLHYRPGTQYKPHHDYFDPAAPGTPAILARGGQRVGTLVMYLNQPLRGGGTVFPELFLEVAPRKGQAVFFSYDRPHASTRTLHGGAPVLEGEKWVATKWLRERHFT